MGPPPDYPAYGHAYLFHFQTALSPEKSFPAVEEFVHQKLDRLTGGSVSFRLDTGGMEK